VPDSGSSFFLPWLVGIGKAMELCLLGDDCPAEEALRIGLINRVVPADQLEAATREWATRLAQGPTKAYGLIKRQLNRALHADLTPPEVLGQAVTDRIFRSRVVSLAEARSAGAGSGSGSGQTFLYDFRWPSSLLAGALGAPHCLDIPFAFDVLDGEDVEALAGPEPPQSLADVVHGAWVGFVTSGDPGWPAHDLDKRTTMLFDVESGPADDPLRAERELWAGGR